MNDFDSSFRPNLDWKPGDPVRPSPTSGGHFESLDPSTLDVRQTYRLMIGAIIPRPIAFVSTMSPEGVGNLAPFSYFNAVSSEPPCLMFSIARKPNGENKDTLRNIEATRQFVVNITSTWMAEAMNATAADYPYGVDEMQKVGLTPLPSLKVKPPRVAESAIQMECVLEGSLEVGDQGAGAATVVVGRILQFHLHSSVHHEGKIDPRALDPLARLAGFSYARLGQVFDIPRKKG
jgi:flavin reductase (DIM6/NTAB) family NADH-FMN oxidoreductase RutF